MNRKERKKIEKKLGLQKFYKTQSRKKYWERVEDNQQNGKRMMEENTKRVKLEQQKAAEEKMSGIISRRAEEIAKEKSIPLIDAMVEAQEIYQEK